LVDAQGLLLILATPAEATQRLGRVTEAGVLAFHEGWCAGAFCSV